LKINVVDVKFYVFECEWHLVRNMLKSRFPHSPPAGVFWGNLCHQMGLKELVEGGGRYCVPYRMYSTYLGLLFQCRVYRTVCTVRTCGYYFNIEYVSGCNFVPYKTYGINPPILFAAFFFETWSQLSWFPPPKISWNSWTAINLPFRWSQPAMLQG
jgi:hypothetical protein